MEIILRRKGKHTRHTFIDHKSFWLSSVRLLCSYLRAELVSCRNGHMWLQNWGTWSPRSGSRCRCSTDESRALRSGIRSKPIPCKLSTHCSSYTWLLPSWVSESSCSGSSDIGRSRECVMRARTLDIAFSSWMRSKTEPGRISTLRETSAHCHAWGSLLLAFFEWIPTGTSPIRKCWRWYPQAGRGSRSSDWLQAASTLPLAGFLGHPANDCMISGFRCTGTWRSRCLRCAWSVIWDWRGSLDECCSIS
jgi:hypothetical protein